jgi:hypothetical protein
MDTKVQLFNVLKSLIASALKLYVCISCDENLEQNEFRGFIWLLFASRANKLNN